MLCNIGEGYHEKRYQWKRRVRRKDRCKDYFVAIFNEDLRRKIFQRKFDWSNPLCYGKIVFIFG